MESKDLEKIIKEILTELFELLGVDYNVSFEKVEREETSYTKVNIDSNDASLLIGYHGETLDSLQNIIQLILYRKTNESHYVVFDVGDYRKNREDRLTEIAKNAANKANFLRKPIALFPMNSFERRIIHLEISEIDNCTSYSEGDEGDRRVIIAPN